MIQEQAVATSCRQGASNLAYTKMLTADIPDEEFGQIMPTIGDGLGYLVVSHKATHLGQLRAWQTALGMASVLG